MSEEPELAEGTTSPLTIACAPIDAITETRDFVVKFNTKLAYSKNGFAFGIASEIICGHLAEFFQLPNPEFAFIEISNAFKASIAANTRIPAHILEIINQNVHANNFGSQIIELDTTSPLSIQIYNPAQLEAASNVFAFDALIFNADRTLQAPNMWAIDDEFIMYDHEKAFNFLLSNQDQIEERFEFRTPTGTSFMHEHIFYPVLRKRDIPFNFFIGGVRHLVQRMKDNSFVCKTQNTCA
ncbi:MAG: hypothetical protein DWG76_04160 [Chloroflexi bacterium]|nr:hypothetical protein [Chloroflexota bacterium]